MIYYLLMRSNILNMECFISNLRRKNPIFSVTSKLLLDCVTRQTCQLDSIPNKIRGQICSLFNNSFALGKIGDLNIFGAKWVALKFFIFIPVVLQFMTVRCLLGVGFFIELYCGSQCLSDKCAILFIVHSLHKWYYAMHGLAPVYSLRTLTPDTFVWETFQFN